MIRLVGLQRVEGFAADQAVHRPWVVALRREQILGTLGVCRQRSSLGDQHDQRPQQRACDVFNHQSPDSRLRECLFGAYDFP